MKLRRDGYELHFTDTSPSSSFGSSGTGRGEGTPIVLIHGFPHSQSLWAQQVPELSRRRRVVTYDLHWHLSIELYVDDLLALLDHLGLERVALGGLSMGGYIALRAAERHPERIDSLILADTGSGADDNAAKLKRVGFVRTIREKGFEAFAEDFIDGVFMPESLAQRPGLLDELRRMVLSHSPSEVEAGLAALAGRLDMSGALASIRVPALILVGERDQVTPPALSEKMRQGIPGARMGIIPGAGHLSCLEAPEEFNRRVSEFLSGPARLAA